MEGDKLRIAQRSIRRYAINQDYSNISAQMLPISPGNISPAAVSAPESAATVKNGGKVLYYAGCMTALTPVIRKSMESILTKAGVDYELMDKDGGLCCGRPMMMAGRFDQARQMVEKNTEIIMNSGADTLLLTCPICYRIFKEKYDLKGIEIIHHTQYIDRLIRSGMLRVDKDTTRYVFHDPCELGRGCGVYEEPREVLSCAGELVEATKNRKESICCGGSLGSLSLGFDKRKSMTENALANLTAGAPDIIVTACPLCRSTFNRYADRPVEDIAEIIDRKCVTSAAGPASLNPGGSN